MDTIQALIKHYIESNGYTVYSISQQSGLNRTTLQKILSGQRKITKEIYEKLLPFFALSPIDKEELEQAFFDQSDWTRAFPDTYGNQAYFGNVHIDALPDRRFPL